MWRLGRHDPRMRSTMTLVVACAGRIDERALAARLTRVCELVPRLRDRIVAGPLAAIPPRWVPDPHFDLSRHLDGAVAPAGLLGVAESVVATDFRPDRPPWRAVLVRTAGGDGLVLHLHHSYTDGLGGVRLVAELFSSESQSEAGWDREPGSRWDAGADVADGAAAGGSAAGGTGAAGGSGGDGSPLEQLWADLEDEAHRAVRLAGRAVPWAVRSVVAARRQPAGLLEAADRIRRQLAAQAGAATSPASPLMVRRSAGLGLHSLTLPLDGLRAAGKRVGGTVNDAFLAGLLGGLRDWHRKHGPVPPSLRLAIPINSRGGAAGLDMVNQIFGAVLRGPMGPLDFDETARLVHEMVGAARHQPLQAVVHDAADVAARTPGLVPVLAGALSSMDVLASNVPGPPWTLWLGDAEVTAMIPFGPRSGAALNATLISYRDAAHLGLNVDPAAVGDPGVLLDCIEAAFAEGLERAAP